MGVAEGNPFWQYTWAHPWPKLCLQANTSGHIFARTFTSDGGEWRNWIEYVTDSRLQSSRWHFDPSHTELLARNDLVSEILFSKGSDKTNTLHPKKRTDKIIIIFISFRLTYLFTNNKKKRMYWMNPSKFECEETRDHHIPDFCVTRKGLAYVSFLLGHSKVNVTVWQAQDDPSTTEYVYTTGDDNTPAFYLLYSVSDNVESLKVS